MRKCKEAKMSLDRNLTVTQKEKRVKQIKISSTVRKICNKPTDPAFCLLFFFFLVLGLAFPHKNNSSVYKAFVLPKNGERKLGVHNERFSGLSLFSSLKINEHICSRHSLVWSWAFCIMYETAGVQKVFIFFWFFNIGYKVRKGNTSIYYVRRNYLCHI